MYIEDNRLAHFFFRKFYWNNRTIKEDIIQACVAALWQARFVYDSSRAKWSTFAFWVCRSAVSRLIRKTRRTNENESLSLDFEPPEGVALKNLIGTEGAYDADVQHLQEIISKVCDSMPNPKTAKVMELKIEGYKQLEIGKMLGISRSNVGSLIRRFRLILHENLENDRSLPAEHPIRKKLVNLKKAGSAADINKNIKELRLKLKMSQNEFGHVFGVGRTAIVNWETGYSIPNKPAIDKLREMGCLI